MDKLHPWEPFKLLQKGHLTLPKRWYWEQGVGPEQCGPGLVCSVTNATFEPNCNTVGVVGPSNHSGCPTSRIKFQIPSGGVGGYFGLLGLKCLVHFNNKRLQALLQLPHEKHAENPNNRKSMKLKHLSTHLSDRIRSLQDYVSSCRVKHKFLKHDNFSGDRWSIHEVKFMKRLSKLFLTSKLLCQSNSALKLQTDHFGYIFFRRLHKIN